MLLFISPIEFKDLFTIDLSKYECNVSNEKDSILIRNFQFRLFENSLHNQCLRCLLIYYAVNKSPDGDPPGINMQN